MAQDSKTRSIVQVAHQVANQADIQVISATRSNFALEGVAFQVLGSVKYDKSKQAQRFHCDEKSTQPSCTLCQRNYEKDQYRMCVSLSCQGTKTVLAMCVECYKLLDFGKQLFYQYETQHFYQKCNETTQSKEKQINLQNLRTKVASICVALGGTITADKTALAQLQEGEVGSEDAKKNIRNLQFKIDKYKEKRDIVRAIYNHIKGGQSNQLQMISQDQLNDLISAQAWQLHGVRDQGKLEKSQQGKCVFCGGDGQQEIYFPYKANGEYEAKKCGLCFVCMDNYFIVGEFLNRLFRYQYDKPFQLNQDGNYSTQAIGWIKEHIMNIKK